MYIKLKMEPQTGSNKHVAGHVTYLKALCGGIYHTPQTVDHIT